MALGQKHKQEEDIGGDLRGKWMSIVLSSMLWGIEPLPEKSPEPVETDFSVVNVPNFCHLLAWLSGSDLVMKGSLFWDSVEASSADKSIYASENALHSL